MLRSLHVKRMTWHDTRHARIQRCPHTLCWHSMATSVLKIRLQKKQKEKQSVWGAVVLNEFSECLSSRPRLI